MTSTRPYLIRAFYEWIVDNNCTPYIVVNANMEYVDVPREYVEGGQIVLNISLIAVQDLVLGQEAIEFQARFGGRACKIYIPTYAVLAIYAKEKNQGMVFAEEEKLGEQNLSISAVSQKKVSKETSTEASHFSKENKKDKGDDDNGGTGGGKGKKSNRSHLTVVK